jgi:hypothetical protein
MAKISTYPVDGLISTDDLIIGSDAENVNITKNFTVGGILSLATLQTVLDNGNSATESITLVGNVAATNVSATTLLSAPTGNITNVNATDVNSSGQVSANDVEVSGLLYDAAASEGVNGQFLKSTGSGILWSSVPADTLQAVLTAGNTTSINIVSTGDIDANSVNVTDASVSGGTLTIEGSISADGSEGVVGQYLTSSGAGQLVQWTNLPIAGWNRFDDGTYTNASRLAVADGVTITLPNDGSALIDTYGPLTFYDKDINTILAVNVNDTYMITVTFKAAAGNTNTGHLDIIMSGPAGYDRISETLKFAKGNGVAQNFHLVYQYYADADFVANGAQITVRAVDTDVDIWDIIYFIQRVQIA